MKKLKRIKDLRKFIPFIDYAASLDEEKYVKLLRIKEWILENKLFAVEVLEKLKQSIDVQYKNLLLDDVKIPKNIMDIFNANASTKFETIDLCSDDEHSEHDNVAPKPSTSSKVVNKKAIEALKKKNDLSDGEIVDSDTDTRSTVVKKPVSFQISAEQIKPNIKVDNKNSTKSLKTKKPQKNVKEHKRKEKSTSILEKEVPVDEQDEQTEDLLNRIDNLFSEADKKNNDSIESVSDDSTSEIVFNLFKRMQEVKAAKNENKDEEFKNEEQIFTRRSYKIENNPIMFDDYNSKTKIKKLRKKRVSNTDNLKSSLLSDLSSDEDIIRPAAVSTPAPQKKNPKTETITYVTLSDTDELNEKSVNEDIGNCKTKNSLLSATSDDTNLEKMDINELSSIFTKLTKGTNIDFEHFLAEVSKTTDNDISSSPTTSPYYAADINVNAYINNEYKDIEQCVSTQASNINETTMPSDNFYNSYPVQAFQPHFPQMPQFPFNQQALPQPPAQQSAAPNSYPIFHVNGRKINLNDPRVIRHLLSFQKSPETGAATQIPSNNQCKDQSNCTLPNSYRSEYSQPITYGEYKRRNMEKAKEAERRNIEKAKEEERRKQAEILSKLQKNCEKVFNQKSKEVVISNSVKSAPPSIGSNTKECTQTQKTVEAIRYNDPKQTILEEPKKAIKPKKTDKQLKTDKRRKSPLLETVETCTDHKSKEKIPARKSTKNNTKKNNTLRVLKELECTVIGFDKLEDYLPLSSSGKRKSSESARSAIAKQLNGQQLHSESTTPEVRTNKRNRISMRRSSMGQAVDQCDISYNSPAPIAKRRKTCAEVSLAALLQDSNTALISKRRKTCVEVSLATLLQDSSTDSADELISDRQNLTTPKKVPLIENSSSDTDTFDFDDFNYMKSKAVALKNQPFVLLQRLTEDEINKHLRRSRPVHPEQMCLNVKLVENTTRKATDYYNTSAPAAPKTKACKNVPNIDVRMTERNTVYCALCKAKPVNLVNHYIRTHKTEPYISRLTTEELEDLQLNCPFAVLAGPSNARAPKYKVQCLFCENELIDSFINFYTHYSAHTGEYAFQCYNCELKKPYRADIQSHKNHAKSCRNARIQKLYVYPTNLMVIYLHCCKLCNFVQLNEANIFKHLREQHAKRGDDAENVQKYIAAAINDAEIINELLPEEEESELLAREAAFENQQESDSELNCTELDIKPDLSPYSSVLDNNNTQSTPMTTVPISNLKTTYTSSFLDKKPASNKEEPEVELPLPIIVKSEVKKENNSYNFEPPLNYYEAHQQYRVYPRDLPYFGKFKCMATDCFFSTDTEEEMLQHLNDHGSSECPPTGWLDCSYCQFLRNACCKPEDLIAHIKLKHSQSRFQCSLCCYRSCVSGSVVIHSTMVHSTEVDSIFMYGCKGEKKLVKERMPDMIKSMFEHVKKLKCAHCSLGFYAISTLREHMHESHGILPTDPALIPEYSCIYCVNDLMLKKDIQEHIALKHPDELVYACRRFLRSPLEIDAIASLQLLNVTELVPSTVIRNTLTSTALVQSTCSTTEAEQIESNTKLLSIACYPNQELNTTDSGTESVAPEQLDEQGDLKPSPEQLVYIAEETLRAVLNKLTSKTGLSPDRLYHCPLATCGGFFSTYALWSRHMSLRHNCLIARCPHCPRHLEFTLSEFNQHFEQHCRHLYVCFVCSETFVNEQATIAHFQAVHSCGSNYRFELIKFNLIHSYRIIVSENVSAERLEFCQILHDNVKKRLEQLVNEESAKLQSRWLVPASTDWLDDYPSFNKNNSKTCVVKPCQYKTRNVEELFQHWEDNHDITGDFKCSRCSFQINNLHSWNPIVEHVRMHECSYVCSVCNFHHSGRKQMSTHILLEHNSRDVPFVSLFHTTERTYVGVGVVFAASCKTFSTTSACFFCNAKNLSVETLSKHFKQVHNISMKHFCEICSIPFKNLSEVDAHHSISHADGQMKVRCEFVSHLQLFIRSAFPLSIDIKSADLIAKTRIIQSNDSELSGRIAKADTIEHNKPSYVDGSAESLATQIRIKNEIPEDDGNASDSEVEVIEEDDLVRAEEFKARRNEQNKKMSATPRLSVKNMFQNNTKLTTPITVATPSPANIAMSIKVTPNNVQTSQSNNLKVPANITTTVLQQKPTQITKTTGPKTDTSHHSLLQQALYNNATISTQQPAQEIRLIVGSSQQQKQPTLQQVHAQQPVFNSNTHNLVSDPQQVRPNKFSSKPKQVSSQQQTQQIHRPQTVTVNQHHNLGSVPQQILPTKFSSILNQGSSEQTTHYPQPVHINQHHNLGSIPKQMPSNEFSSPPNPGSLQQQTISISKTTLQTNINTQQSDNHQKQHLSYIPQQIRPNEQKVHYNNVNILKNTLQTTYPQQPVIPNQLQYSGVVSQHIRPKIQVQQLQQPYSNSPAVQTSPQTISVRLSAPVSTNQIIMDPRVPNFQSEEFVPFAQNWVPPSSLSVNYVTPTNRNNTQQINYTTQFPPTQTHPQSFTRPPHDYFH